MKKLIDTIYDLGITHKFYDDGSATMEWEDLDSGKIIKIESITLKN